MVQTPAGVPSDFERPPKALNHAGRVRTVGVEIEFGGLAGAQAARLIQRRFGGTIRELDSNAWQIEQTSLGDFTVELDIWFAHPEPRDTTDEVDIAFAHLAGQAASLVVPYEIITPPIPWDRLTEIDGLLLECAHEGARGTDASVFYAFGLHLNPEVPDFEPATLTSILKAYALLGPWLWNEINPDTTRRLLGFLTPFDDVYVRQLADTAYWPTLPSLIDDYIAANPSRHRDLDALPLFAFLDNDRVTASLPRQKMNRRPTFHYRLPDSRIGQAGWSLAPDWNRWVAVEKLAADRPRLDALCRKYQDCPEGRDQWAGIVAALAMA